MARGCERRGADTRAQARDGASECSMGPMTCGARAWARSAPATTTARRGARAGRGGCGTLGGLHPVSPLRSERTPLHGAMRAHLAIFLEEARARSAHGFGQPGLVKRELREEPACGVLAHGFAAAAGAAASPPPWRSLAERDGRRALFEVLHSANLRFFAELLH